MGQIIDPADTVGLRDERVVGSHEQIDALLPLPLLNCENTQCRVHNFRPHRNHGGVKSTDCRCPGCYGQGT